MRAEKQVSGSQIADPMAPAPAVTTAVLPRSSGPSNRTLLGPGCRSLTTV